MARITWRLRPNFWPFHHLPCRYNYHPGVILAEKNIAEIGNPDQLLARRGLYWQLNQVNAQSAPERSRREEPALALAV